MGLRLLWESIVGRVMSFCRGLMTAIPRKGDDHLSHRMMSVCGGSIDSSREECDAQQFFSEFIHKLGAAIQRLRLNAVQSIQPRRERIAKAAVSVVDVKAPLLKKQSRSRILNPNTIFQPRRHGVSDLDDKVPKFLQQQR